MRQRVIVLLLSVGFALTACGGGSEPGTEPEPAPGRSSEASSVTAAAPVSPSFGTTRPDGPCEYYVGANPTWEEFRADVRRSTLVVWGKAITDDPDSGTRSGIGEKSMLEAMPPGAAAEITQFMCTVSPSASAEQIYPNVEMLKNIRGMNLRTALTEVDCSGDLDTPNAYAITTIDPEATAAKMRSIICP